MNTSHFVVGERVKLTSLCPIEPECIAPMPGDTGTLVHGPSTPDDHHWGVEFDRLSTVWSIDEHYLDHMKH